jgi:hypothetical protein
MRFRTAQLTPIETKPVIAQARACRTRAGRAARVSAARRSD